MGRAQIIAGSVGILTETVLRGAKLAAGDRDLIVRGKGSARADVTS